MKTTSLSAPGYEDPFWTICKGHVTPEVFNKAFESEGWSNGSFTQEDLSYEYWEQHPDRSWRKTVKDSVGAEPVTVIEW